MARPRKSERDAAGIRLANAFWTLLEHHRLANITYGARHETESTSPEFFLSFVKNNSEFLVNQIGIAQGIPRDAVLERVRATLRIAGMNDR